VNRRGRDALVGLCFLAAVTAAVLATLRRNAAPNLGFTVERCLRNVAQCRGEPYLDLLGAYVPRSRTKDAPGCVTQLELQAPSGAPPGRIRICAQRVLPDLEAPSANGLPLLHARGHFVGDHFDASAVELVTHEPAR
jgi:hypothetical protein